MLDYSAEREELAFEYRFDFFNIFFQLDSVHYNDDIVDEITIIMILYE